ncbi:MAG: hypothetical protein HY430_03245 [Candidatus Levybacteria bacterium]|nr:hypothetical protein [Candidatus Levybacteria bacterium]
MNGLIKHLLSDKIIAYSASLALLCNVVSLLFLLFLYRQLPPFLPLYNQLPWGEPRLGQRIEIFIPIGLSISLWIINMVLAHFLYENMPLISRMLSLTGFVISLIACIFLFRTIQIII